MYEDKQKICDLLLIALQETRDGSKLSELAYNEETELVTVTYAHGHTIPVNVACDSGCALIRDVMNHVGY